MKNKFLTVSNAQPAIFASSKHSRPTVVANEVVTLPTMVVNEVVTTFLRVVASLLQSFLIFNPYARYVSYRVILLLIVGTALSKTFNLQVMKLNQSKLALLHNMALIQNQQLGVLTPVRVTISHQT